MIVKNEANNLERLFASLYKYIDYFVISDTGSTDQTIEILYDLGKLYNVPGKVLSHAWVDFGYNRQLALEAAIQAKNAKEHDCEWLLIIDADEELITIDKLWKIKLQEGWSYTTFKKLGGLSYKNLFLLWIESQQWQWQGVVHEYLLNPSNLHKKKHTNDVCIMAHQFEGSNSRRFED